MENICTTLNEHARTHPHAPALIDGSLELDWQSLAAAMDRGASRLRGAGLRPGQRAGILLREGAGFVIALLAAARAGITAVPLDWRAPVPEKSRVAAAFGVDMLICEPGAPMPPDVAAMDAGPGWWDEGNTAALPAAGGDAPLMILLSSGTTGTPSGAVVSHADYLARCGRNRPWLDAIGIPRYLSASPLCFSGGLHYCLLTLIRGGTVAMYPPIFTAEEYVAAAREHRANLLFIPPTVLRWLLDLPAGQSPLLPDATVILGAGPLHADEKRAAARRVSPRVIEVYGSAQTGQITVLLPGDFDTHGASVGRPLGGIEVDICGPAGDPLEPGEIGQLRCRGPGVSVHVLGAETPPDAGGWYYPGDLADRDTHGFVHLRGRSDEVINHGGSNVYPVVIEAALRAHDAVADAAVVGRPSAGHGEDIVAYVELAAPADAPALLAHLRSRLPGKLVPAQILIRDALPRTASGKVLKQALQ